MKITFNPQYCRQTELILKLYLNRNDTEPVEYIIINPYTILAKHDGIWVTIRVRDLVEYFFLVHV